MQLTPYDIFKKDDYDALVWVQAVPDLQTASERIRELRDSLGGTYVVFDQRTQQITPAS